MPKRHQIECMGGTATMIVGDDGAVTFEGWDEEAEAAWLAIGGEPSPCWVVARAIKEGRLDEELLKQAKTANTQLVESLISAGANVNTKKNKNWTPLHIAAKNKHADIVSLLIKNGADINARNREDWTPLHWATWKMRHNNVATLLIASGANVNAKGIDGWTPLHGAAWNSYIDTANLLLENGADVNAKTNSGSTPLHFAKAGNNTDTVTFLEKWIEEHS